MERSNTDLASTSSIYHRCWSVDGENDRKKIKNPSNQTEIAELTDKNSMDIFGLAAWYKMNITFIPIPAKIPNSNGSTRQAMKAAIPGTKSVSV